MDKLSTLKPKTSVIDLRVGSSAGVPRIRGWKLVQIRERILLRDGYSCQVCKRVSTRLEVDHIIPLYLGGAESDENRQSLCRECHEAKNDKEKNERMINAT
jgi:5-methylcytosine-specific restriction enzyme A